MGSYHSYSAAVLKRPVDHAVLLQVCISICSIIQRQKCFIQWTPSVPSNSNFCIWSVETVFIIATKTPNSQGGGDSDSHIHSHMFMKKTKRELMNRFHISLPTHSTAHDFHTAKRKMVLGCRQAVSSEASHQPAGRQSISLAPPPISLRASQYPQCQ